MPLTEKQIAGMLEKLSDPQKQSLERSYQIMLAFMSTHPDQLIVASVSESEFGMTVLPVAQNPIDAIRLVVDLRESLDSEGTLDRFQMTKDK